MDVNGEPWFVAKDVARALGYPESSLRQLNNLFGHVPDEWKGRNWIMTPGGEQEMLIISEQGLYFFLGRSDKPKALPYQMWVAGDVVPTIRRTGQYGGYALPRVPQSFPDALRMIADIEEEKQLALEQRDYYKRTKAEIGSRREATSMATASAAVRQHFAACPIIPTGTHMPLGTRLNIPQRLASHTVRSGARPLVRLCFKAAPAGGVTSSYPLPCPGPPHGIKGYKHPLTLSGSCFYHLEYQRFFAAHPPTFQPCATTVAFAFPPPAIPQQSRFPLPAGVAFG